MYLWRIKKLAGDLKADRVSEWEQVKYLLVLVLPMIAFSYLPAFLAMLGPAIMSAVPLFLEMVVFLAITIGGITMNFRANQRGDGREFLKRFICLSVPVNIRILIYSLPIFLVLGVFSVFLGEVMGVSLAEQSSSIFALGTELLSYLWIRSYILEISGASSGAQE